MPTYTNLVVLQGWLEIESVSVTRIDRTQVPVLNGWIYTTDRAGLEDCFDERHPVLISGKPAEAFLEITRKTQDKLSGSINMGLVDMPFSDNQTTKVLTNQKRPFVIAQGNCFLTRVVLAWMCGTCRSWGCHGVPWSR